MLPRIKEVRPMPDYCLRIVFDDGRKVLYDVKDDMEQIESYRDLATIHGLFNQVQLDPSRTCVYWNCLLYTSPEIYESWLSEILSKRASSIRSVLA